MGRVVWIVLVVCAAVAAFWWNGRARFADVVPAPHGAPPAPEAPAPGGGRQALPQVGGTASGAGTDAVAGDVAFERAAPDASQASRWNDEAIAALERGDLAQAVELFGRCLSESPDEPVFGHNLAEALARLAAAEYQSGAAGSLASAIEHLARAVELAPEREELAVRLARWRETASAEEGFWVDASAHFELAYDGERSELLWNSTRIFDVLEAAYQDFGELFVGYPVEAGRARIRVVLYRRAEFDAITGIGHWAGGVFDGTVRIPLEDLGTEEERLRRVLRHELVHVFVRAIGGRDVPSWLDEGLAQRLELEGQAARSARERRARDALAGVELHPIATLRSGIAGWSDAAAIRRAYDEALAFTAWLEPRFGERLAFDLVRAAGAGPSVEERFPHATGSTLEAAWAEFAAGL